MTAGMFIAAASVYYFLVPSKIVVGSISGLSIVISALFEQAGIVIKVSTVVLIINAILLVLAYFLIGKEFGVKTCYTALILGPMMDLWEKICPYTALLAPGETSVMGDLWFDLICFVLILSMSQAIMFRINASTGGLDILAKIVNKYLHFDIGLSVTIAGVVICCTAFFVNPFRLVIIGLIGMLVISWRLNVLAMGDREARTMGLNVSANKVAVIAFATLATAGAVSISGVIGWVGLVVPHICRMIFGSDNRKLIPASISLGACFMVLVDTICRSLTAGEIPLGIVTAIVGGPFFIWLLKKTKGGSWQ